MTTTSGPAAALTLECVRHRQRDLVADGVNRTVRLTSDRQLMTPGQRGEHLGDRRVGDRSLHRVGAAPCHGETVRAEPVGGGAGQVGLADPGLAADEHGV